MKKIWVLLFTVIICLSFAACGETDTDASGESGSNLTGSDTKSKVSGPFSDPTQFTIMVNGEEYAFPMTYDTLVAHGWTYVSDPEEELIPRRHRINQNTMFSNEKKQFVTAGFGNFDQVTLPLSQCHIVSFNTTHSNFLRHVEDGELVLPKGIKLGESTKEEVLAAYGEQSENGDIKSELSLTYSYVDEDGEVDRLRELKLGFLDLNKDGTKILQSVELIYFVDPNGEE